MTAVEDDTRHAAGNLKLLADYVIVNLPRSVREFLECGILTAKNGVVVHFYDITHEDDRYRTSWGFMQEAAARWGERWNVQGEGFPGRMLHTSIMCVLNLCRPAISHICLENMWRGT